MAKSTLKIQGAIQVGALENAPANPTAGTIFFDSTNQKVLMHDGAQFNQVMDQALIDAVIGSINQSPLNYVLSGSTVADHLEAIDTALATAGEKEFKDDEFRVKDTVDETKKVAFEVSAVATSTTRTISVPDSDVDLAKIDANESAISANTSAISSNDSDIATNASSISSNSTQIASNSSAIGINSTNISSNTSSISTNTTDIATNTASISTNQSNIATNTSDIGTNQTNIASNTSAISSKAEDADVVKKDGSVAFTADQSMGSNKLTNVADATAGSDAVNKSQLDVKADDADVLKHDGSVALSADLSAGSFKITDLAAPVNDNDAARKIDVDNAAAGIISKEACRVASTASLTLSGLQTVDGISLSSADRVLVKNQVDQTENGIYVVGSGSWVRSEDFDGTPAAEVQGGALVYVTEGTVNQGTSFRLQGTGNLTPDSDALIWLTYSKAESISAGDGLDKNGLELSVDASNLAGSGLEEDGSNNLQISAAAAGNGLSGGAGSALEVNVDSSTIEISSDSLRIKDAGIDNAKISPSAAIELSKLEALSASKALASDVSGEIVASTVSLAELELLSGVSSSVQTQLDAKMESLSDDAAPSLGGDLDLGANVLVHDADGLKRGSSASDFLEEEYVHSVSLSASQSATSIPALSFAKASFDAVEIVYKMKDSAGSLRMGTIRVVTDGVNVNINDVGTEIGNTDDLQFDAAINGANVEIRYDSGLNTASMKCDVKRFKV